MGLKPTRRDTRGLQPEVDAISGRLTPAADLVVCDVEGLRGHAIGSIGGRFISRARFLPSYNDLQRGDPGPILDDTQRREIPGTGAVWWDTTTLGLEVDDDTLLVDDDGNVLITDT